ncbi:MAG: MFS transporter [Planctomycetota bacterium]|nr:MFS transporter [Planctomycetota bacterium]
MSASVAAPLRRGSSRRRPGAGHDPSPRVPELLRFAAFYVALFVVLGAWVPYWPLWLSSRGATDAEIGVLVGIGILARAAATPWFASRADRSGHRRGWMTGLAVASGLLFAPFFWANGFAALAAFSLAFGLVYPPLFPLGDSMSAIEAQRSPRFDYGRVRSFGSLSFLATALLVGEVLPGRSIDLVYWAILLGLVATAFTTLLLPARGDDEDHHESPAARQPMRTLIRDRTFVRVLTATSLIQASHAAYYGFSTLHWKASGVAEGTIGLLWAEGVLAEILLFTVGRNLTSRLRTSGLFALGATAAILRWLALAATTDPTALAATNWLHGLSFGATHLAAYGYVASRIPRRLASTAQSLLSALATGLTSAGATAIAGLLFTRSPTLAFGSMSALAALGLWTALGLRRADDERRG